MNARRSIAVSIRAALAGVMVFLSLACAIPTAGGGTRLFSSTTATQPSSTFVLDVANRGWSDVVVYLADGSTPKRLGSVPPLKEMRLHIYRGSGHLRLLLRPLGSTEGYSPEPIWVGPGGAAELTIQPLLSTSELFVR